MSAPDLNARAPAYPIATGNGVMATGVNLLDHFALGAMQALLTHSHELSFDDVADEAYKMAWAMLKRRESHER